MIIPVGSEIDEEEQQKAGEALFVFLLNTEMIKQSNYRCRLPFEGLHLDTSRAGSTRARRRWEIRAARGPGELSVAARKLLVVRVGGW